MKVLAITGILIGALILAYLWAWIGWLLYRYQVSPDGGLAMLGWDLIGFAAIAVLTFLAVVSVAAA